MSTELRVLSALRLPQNSHYVNKLSDNLFTNERQQLFIAMRKAFQRYGTMSHEAVKHFYEADVPAELDFPTAIDLVPAIDDLIRMARKRILQTSIPLMQAEAASFDPTGDSVKKTLEDIATLSADDDVGIASGISQFTTTLRQKVSGLYRYLKTGSKFLDRRFGGEWCRGGLTIITGASGGGKTAFMGNAALRMAQEGIAVGIIELEMTRDQLVARWVADVSGINGTSLRLGRNLDNTPFTDDQINRIEEAKNYVAKLPIYISDRGMMDANTVTFQIERFYREFGCEVVFIDYLQLISVDAGLGKHYGLSEAARQMINVAKKYNIAVVALAQVNKEGTIRDTGDVEKHAAVWVHIEMGPTIDDSGFREASLEMRKNRHGDGGKYTVMFNGSTMHFIFPEDAEAALYNGTS